MDDDRHLGYHFRVHLGLPKEAKTVVNLSRNRDTHSGENAAHADHHTADHTGHDAGAHADERAVAHKS